MQVPKVCSSLSLVAAIKLSNPARAQELLLLKVSAAGQLPLDCHAQHGHHDTSQHGNLHNLQHCSLHCAG